MDKKQHSPTLAINCFMLNSHCINVIDLKYLKGKPKGYGVDNWLYDNFSVILWDNNGVVLNDK